VTEPADPRASDSSSTLPRGRHRLSREDVERHQRARLLDAVVVVAGERGYSEFAVQHLIAAAGVSRSTFYEHFTHKREVVLAACEAILARLLTLIERACAAQAEWPSKVRAAIAAALRFAAAEPDAARLLNIHLCSARDEAAGRVLGSSERLVALLAAGRDRYPRAAQLPALTERALVGAIWVTIATQLIGGEPERLEELEAQLVELALLPYLGAPEAAALASAAA
jgi:AcrR family transcriptional regulator